MLYGPGYLLDQDVILVTMNYRLGIFGFLTLGDEELPGNIGLWDQLGGLKWIEKNIGAFGGNPDKVTIFGQSAGSWSINYQLASHQSKGYFSSAIAQSGSILLSPIVNTGKTKGQALGADQNHKLYLQRVSGV